MHVATTREEKLSGQRRPGDPASQAEAAVTGGGALATTIMIVI